jgi:hypothetical protein
MALQKNNTINLYVNSKFALKQLNGTSNCLYDFSNLPIDDGEIFVSIQSAQIPGTFYNVDDINNRLDYTISGGGGSSHTLIIPPANYNVNSLLTYLTANMTGFTITFNGQTNKYTFNRSSGGQFTFSSTSTCFELLGFQEGQSYTSVALTLTSPLCVNFFTIQAVLIEITNLITNNKTSNAAENNPSILVSIPITTSQNSVLSYYNVFNLHERINTIKNFASLQIRLLDQDLDLLDLNGANWTATIQLSY